MLNINYSKNFIDIKKTFKFFCYILFYLRDKYTFFALIKQIYFFILKINIQLNYIK